MKERKPVTREFAVRCRAVKTKIEKSKVPDDFITVTGYNRKYAIGILGGGGKTNILRPHGKPVKARITRKTGKGGSVKNAAARTRLPSSRKGCILGI
jgi:hypothetical protein